MARLRPCWLLVAALGAPGAVHGADAAPKPKVAVSGIEALQGVSKDTAAILEDIVASDVEALGRYEVVTNKQIAAVLGLERQKQLLGCADDTSCLAEVGGALGVQYLLLTQAGQIGSQVRVSLTLVAPDTAKVVARASVFSDPAGDALVASTRQVVRDLFRQLGVETAPPARPVNPAGIALVAGAGALLAGGVVLGVLAKTKYDALAAQQGAADYEATWTREAPGIRGMAIAADVLYGATAVATGLGIFFLVRKPAVQPSVSVVGALNPSGGSVVVTGSF